MRLRNIPGSREALVESPFVVDDPREQKGRWNQLFGEDRPLHIEVGMGKGRFLMDLSEAHPEINYIGIEMYSSVLIRAVQKAEERELSNFRFLRLDARELPDCFAAGEVDRIYLNFSDPWPKDRHAKRRLTSHQFLEKYEQVLSETGQIEFKTDNLDLFTFSLEEIRRRGWVLTYHTFDLHADAKEMEHNIMTEYEERFSSMGNPICKLTAHPNH